MSLVVLGAGLALAGPAAAAEQSITFPNSSTFGFYSYSPPTPTIKTGDAADLQRELREPSARVGQRQLRR